MDQPAARPASTREREAQTLLHPPVSSVDAALTSPALALLQCHAPDSARSGAHDLDTPCVREC
jgi:hypothetical protein